MSATPLTPQQFAEAYGLVPGPAVVAQAPTAIAYTTQTGDRWDLIAWRFYGDATLISGIVLANPTVAISPVLPTGTPVFVPVIAPPAAPANSLPWQP